MGAVVSPGQTLAEAFTDESLNVVVNVGEAEAALIPGLFDGANAKAECADRIRRHDLCHFGKSHQSSASELDARTRTLAVTVSLDGGDRLQPVAGPLPASGAPPALINAYAEVEISGAKAPNTYRVPSEQQFTARPSGWLAMDR